MEKEIKINDKKYFQCEICKFAYKEKEITEKCQNWCEEHNSCNLDITKHAVNI